MRSVSKSDFELLKPFAYKPTDSGPIIEVPIHPNEFGDTTDLASVPPLLWGLLPSYGRQLRAALLHDRLCNKVDKQPDKALAYAERRYADDVFLEAMRDPGKGTKVDIDKRVGWFRSRLFWAGVSFGRYWKFRKFLAVLLTLHVLVGVLAIDLILGLPPLPWLAERLSWSWLLDARVLVAIWALALVLSFVWGRDWPVPFLGLLVGPLILPVLLVTFVAQLLLGLPDAVLRLVQPSEQPPANFGPTVSKFPRSEASNDPGTPTSAS